MRALDSMHESQLEEARGIIEQGLPTKYKPSVKLLDNRQVFERMVAQKKYTEAHNMRAEIEKMEV